VTGTQRRALLAVASAAVTVDLLVKATAVRWLTEPVEVAGILALRVTRNSGIAFGLGADQPPWVVVAVTGAAVIALFVAAFRGLLSGAVPAGLILGGGLANLGDRIHGGSVVDLFDVGWWPVFNPADVFLTIGMAWLLISSLDTDRQGDDRRQDADDRGELRRLAGYFW
jgi:signal peptidase II